ncbi:MAG TPA: ribulose-phosphate 3-epimerase [Candidatus Saccharimonadales bacterium]|nr:ribulose-phosphate 3-epimerase [Candidatus Saccharimonadales bacterium]
MVEILPAILAKTSSDYHKKLKAIEPLTEWVQIDIVDNVYARNQTIAAKDVAAIRTKVKFEIQLMVEQIENWLDPFIELKPGRIIFPLESARDPLGLINHMKQHQIPFGFSLDPETKVERLQHFVDKIDVALLLAVHPGFSGQHFVYGVLDKIRKLRAMRPDLIIEIDGGIEPDTAKKCAEVGANVLASGSYIFENAKMDGATYNEKVSHALESLKEAVADVIPETYA